MAVSGADSAKINRILTTTLDRYSPQISNELARNDGVIGVFGQRGAIKVVSGGERAIETLDTTENTNFNFRSRYAEIDTDLQDSRKQAKYAWATIDGAVVMNDIEIAINSGEAKIYDLMEAEILNAKRTLIRKIANALRALTPAATDPESVITAIQNTATGSQTGTFGELSRVTNTFWRSQYSGTAMDLSAASGLESLLAFMLDYCAKGNSKLDAPDFGLTTGTLYAALSAGRGDDLRRYAPNSKVLELGFDNIVVNGATIIADPSIASGDLYLINTNHMFLQVLRTKNMQNVGDRPQTMPVSVKSFQDGYNSLNAASIMHLTFALTCSSLQRQGIATNCS